MGTVVEPKPLHVIVVGAGESQTPASHLITQILTTPGLAGIAVAHGLRKHNISYELVDRETTPRDRNWGITLSWALPLLEALLPDDLIPSLQRCQPDTSLAVADASAQGVLIRDGATGGECTEQPLSPSNS
jgi:hypothetical protein